MPLRSLLLVVAALVAGRASAQISADRPGLASSSETVGRGVVQIEAGLPEASRTTFDFANAALTTASFPVALRYGLTSRVELRASTPSAYDAVRLSSDDPGNRRSDSRIGFDVLTVGAKVGLNVGSGTLALVPEVDLPVRGNGGSALRLDAPATFPLGDFSVTLAPGLVAGDNGLGLNAIGSVSRSFGALSAYAELGAFPSADVDGANETPVLAGGGVAARIDADTQLDAFFDAGLGGGAPDLTVGIGIAHRFK